MSGLLRLADARLATLPSAVGAGLSPQERDAAQAAASAPVAPPFELACEGEVWTVRYAGRVFHLKDSLGLHYLARLCAEPNREIHALEADLLARTIRTGTFCVYRPEVARAPTAN